MSKTTSVSVDAIISRIRDSAKRHADEIRRGRFATWVDLGETYVGALEIEGDDTARRSAEFHSGNRTDPLSGEDRREQS